MMEHETESLDTPGSFAGMITVYKLSSHQTNVYVTKDINSVMEIVRDSGVGKKWLIVVDEMDEVNYNNLSEFDGF